MISRFEDIYSGDEEIKFVEIKGLANIVKQTVGFKIFLETTQKV